MNAFGFNKPSLMRRMKSSPFCYIDKSFVRLLCNIKHRVKPILIVKPWKKLDFIRNSMKKINSSKKRLKY